jgi:uncharacterized protein (TIGR03663 family)
MTRGIIIGLLLALAAALALRLPRLSLRPMHNDEAVNAIKFGQLWEKGAYQYDPNEHHGPSLYYATLALGRASAGPDFAHFSETRLRLLPVLFGLGLICLLPLLVDGLGRRGVLWAGLLTAVSPAMVFYSRYYIHEVLLVFFTFLALAAGWRYWRSRQIGWLLLAGAGLGLMTATKETFVIILFAAGVAVFLNQAWNRALDASGLPVKAPPLKIPHLAAGLGVAVLVWAVLFSSFFSNWTGLLDSFRTFKFWGSRAAGETTHVHPWYFFLHRLLFFHSDKGPFWTEALVLALALIAAWAGFARRRLGRASASFVRFLAFYTFLLTAFYSLLPYKTTWCLLGFWHGMILLAGVGAAVSLRSIRKRAARWTVALVLLAGSGHLGWEAWQLNENSAFAADPRNPYVYAQTSPDVLNLVEQVNDLADSHPQGHNMLVKVIANESDYWPLPWYLRSFHRVGWWDSLPPDPYAPVMVVSANLHANLDENRTHQMPHYYQLRPQVFLELYAETNLWSNCLVKHPPGRE